LHPRIFLVTGTGTGVGKTATTALLARRLSDTGTCVAALKPISSGDRHDAILLRAAAGSRLSLDEVNPWHLRKPLAPLVAAEYEGRIIECRDVIAHIHRVAGEAEFVLVEGAGGLLSPLGRDFDSRSLIRGLRARPIIVAPNRLGALNDVLLTLDALPAAYRAMARVCLVSPGRRGLVAATNLGFLRRRLAPAPVVDVPFLRDWPAAFETARARRIGAEIARALNLENRP
jgi:dethiobiotin synthetase